MSAEQIPTKDKILSQYRLLGLKPFIFPSDDTRGESLRDNSYETWSSLDKSAKMELYILREELLPLFDVRNFSEIYEVCSESPEARDQINSRIIEYYGGKYLETSIDFEAKEYRITRSLELADEMIQKLINKETGFFREMHLEQINEISKAKRPIDLFMYVFSPTAPEDLRFEARRKLILADLGLRVLAEMEKNAENTEMDRFIQFLDENIWQGGTAESIPVEVVSTHDSDTYACIRVQYLQPLIEYPQGFKVRFPPGDTMDQEHSLNLLLNPNQRYLSFRARVWSATNDGQVEFAKFEDRDKDPVSMMLKLLRKNTKNPQTIEDRHGIKIVVDSTSTARRFISVLKKQIEQSYRESASIRDVTDTIGEKGTFNGDNAGSSNKLETIKYIIALPGNFEIEVQLYTMRTYFDYMYHLDTGWEKYSVSRLIDPGVMDTLFPMKIYGIPWEEMKESVLRRRHLAQRDSATSLIPVARRWNNKLQWMYSTPQLDMDLPSLLSKLDKLPPFDYVVPLDLRSDLVAQKIATHFDESTANLFFKEKGVTDVLSSIPKDKRVLLVAIVGSGCEFMNDLKSSYPNVTTAVLLFRPENRDEIDKADIIGRRVGNEQYITFTWDRIAKE